MADLIRNPHEAIQPDFGADKHAHQRQLLREGGLMEEQAIAMLANLWTSTNARDRADWNCIQEQRALARQEDKQVAQQEVEWQRQEDEVLLEAVSRPVLPIGNASANVSICFLDFLTAF